MDSLSKFKQFWLELESGYGRTLEFNPITFPLCLSFIFLLLFKLFRYKKTTNLPPSPPKLPLIGNLHQLGTLPHRSLAALSAKYGPDLMLLKLGQIPTLVVSSSKMSREIMKTHDINFSNRPQTTAQKLLFYECQDIAFTSYGEFWRQAKKICVLELLSVKKVESFQNEREEEVALLIDRIHNACAGNSGDFVNLSQLLISTSNNIASRCIFGEKFEDENGNSTFGDVIKNVMVSLTKFCVADFLPAFRWIDVVRGFIGELKTTFKTLDAFFDKVIDEQREKMCIDGDQYDKKNFVTIMLKLQQDYHFTRDNLKAILLDMFVGGTDTSATSLEWTMTELMRNPLIMKKVQQEVRRQVGKKSKIEMNDIDKMEYMKCVIKESLRLHPPAPLLVPREIGDSHVNIEGYHIPSKTRVYVNAWAIQRDPEIWERPNDFIPERFMNNSVDFQGQDYEFIPFGSGRRKCPGILFGIASVEYVLANLLYWFDWKVPDGTVIDLEEENGLTVCKKTPLELKPIPYIF